MRHKPVYVGHIYEVSFDAATGKQRNESHFFQVMGRSIDVCGHRHRTERAAKPCLRRIQKQYAAWRSRIYKQTALGRTVKKAFGFAQ